MVNVRDYWRQTKQKTSINIFPDKEDDCDRKSNYIVTWVEFKDHIENAYSFI